MDEHAFDWIHTFAKCLFLHSGYMGIMINSVLSGLPLSVHPNKRNSIQPASHWLSSSVGCAIQITIEFIFHSL